MTVGLQLGKKPRERNIEEIVLRETVINPSNSLS